MKKTLGVLMMVLLAAMLVVSCDDNDGSTTLHKVTFEYDNGEANVVKEVKDGETVAAPSEDPTKSKYVFDCWALDGKDAAFDFETAITEDITLKALWISTPEVAKDATTFTLGDTTWNVLAVDEVNNLALLIYSGIGGNGSFSDFTSYQESNIRKQILPTFLRDNGLSTKYMKKVAFVDQNSGDGKDDIEKTEIDDTKGTDYVFILSYNEATNTDYFKNQSARIDSNNKQWWLRPNGDDTFRYVDTDGDIKTGAAGQNLGVRPAFWYHWND